MTDHIRVEVDITGGDEDSCSFDGWLLEIYVSIGTINMRFNVYVDYEKMTYKQWIRFFENKVAFLSFCGGACMSSVGDTYELTNRSEGNSSKIIVPKSLLLPILRKEITEAHEAGVIKK